MKTDLDLLIEFHSWFFPASLGDSIKGDLLFLEWKRQWLPRMTTNTKNLSDAEYASTLTKLKQEAPAYLHYLRSTSFPSLPAEMKPFPEN